MFGIKSNKIYDTRKGCFIYVKNQPIFIKFCYKSSYFMSEWRCIKSCGACCNLEPSDRPDLGDYLSESELALYLSMVGENGWCINYDQNSRTCQIYDDRPRFCRVKPDIFEQMYDIPLDEFEEFAIDCCHQQIEAVYGEESDEMNRYLMEVN